MPKVGAVGVVLDDAVVTVVGDIDGTVGVDGNTPWVIERRRDEVAPLRDEVAVWLELLDAVVVAIDDEDPRDVCCRGIVGY